MSVHVAVCGEGLATNLTGERSLTGVDQHVSVQGAEGGQHLPAQTAVVDLGLPGGIRGVGGGLHLVVAPEVAGEIFLAGHQVAADWTLVVSCLTLQRQFLVLLVHLQSA